MLNKLLYDHENRLHEPCSMELKKYIFPDILDMFYGPGSNSLATVSIDGEGPE